MEIGRVVAGRYAVVEEIGQGGMGSVVRAYDGKLRREVAVKRLRVDAGDRSHRERMVREAHAMAQLSHPNVVAIYDVEDSRAGVLLVMELVEGQTLREWVTPQRPWTEVVAVYVAAARGLFAAHRVGIVHRDFKPANVLIGRDASQVKVADFGLAKFAGDEPSASHVSSDVELGLRTSGDDLTAVGTVMGTPRYMSPEQHAGEEVTPAADQFSWCVALWEALHGEAPFASAADKRAGPPPWRRKNVRGTVVRAIERGLSPRPEDRWPDLSVLIEQLQPRSRRSWGLVAGGCGAVGMVAAFGLARPRDDDPCTAAQSQISMTWSAAQRGQVRDALLTAAPHYGGDVADRVEAQIDAFTTEWVSSYTDACEATHLRHEQSSEVLDLRTACLRRAQGDLAGLVSVLVEPDPATAAKAHLLAQQLPTLVHCSDTTALKAAVPPPASAELAAQVEAARRLIARARAQSVAGKLDEAFQTLAPLPERVEEIEYEPVRAELLLVRGQILEGQEQAEAAFAMHREALALALEYGQWSTAVEASFRLSFVAGSYLNEPRQALAYYDFSLGMVRRPDVGDHVEAYVRRGYAGSLDRLGDLDGAQREYEKALELFTGLYGTDDWRSATALQGLAAIHFRKQEFELARKRFSEVLGIEEQQLGADHPLTMTTKANLASVLLISGNAAEAEPVCAQVYAQHRRVLGDTHRSTFLAASNLAAAYMVQRKYDAAYELLSEVVEPLEAQGLAGRPFVLTLRDNYAIVLSELGHVDEAIAEARALVAIRRERQGDEHADTSRAYYVLGDLLRKAGEYEEATTVLERSLAIDAARVGPDDPDRVSASIALGRTYAETGQTSKAIALLRDAWLVIRDDELGLDVRGECAYALGQLLVRDAATRSEGLEMGAEAKKAIAQHVGTDNPLYLEVSQWLAEQSAPGRE
jgi:serine/threonine protein kinase/TolA-binding protein